MYKLLDGNERFVASGIMAGALSITLLPVGDAFEIWKNYIGTLIFINISDLEEHSYRKA